MSATEEPLSQVVVGRLQENCYLIRDGSNLALIDPGAEATKIIEMIRSLHVEDPKISILLTHGHFDHIGAIPDLLKALDDVPIYVNPKDKEMLVNSHINGSFHSGPAFDLAKYSGQFKYVNGGDTISIGNLSIRAIAIPGHTPGGLMYVDDCHKCVFSGDSLFRHSIGATWVEGAEELLISGLKSAIAALPKDYSVYPGHGDSTTIEEESQNNPFL